MTTAKVFTNGRSQAVLIPKEYHISEDEIYIQKIGDALMLVPKTKAVKLFRESLNEFTDDYMEEHPKEQGFEKREEL